MTELQKAMEEFNKGKSKEFMKKVNDYFATPRVVIQIPVTSPKKEKPKENK